ncbi:MAG: SpoVR family protein [Firmicutes bacterium]|nr:SpoVR family protein [Bacillota bacterium]
MIDTLELWDAQLREEAARLGLDDGPIDWRLVEADRIYELAATGMPGVMRHWTHGRDYWYQRSRLSQGEGRLYEMIVHAEPPIAYLLEGNTVAAQKLVMAHCRGHSFLYRRHVLYRNHPTDYPERFHAQDARRQEYVEEYGPDAVEWVLDRAYALDDQVAEEPERPAPSPPTRIDPYQDLFPRESAPKPVRPPRYRLPTRDLLGFVGRHSPVLADWERDLVMSVRQEGLALRPNRETKMIHEGWACWVQQTLCNRLAIPDAEQVEMARVWANVVSAHPASLNPYLLGWRFIGWLVDQYGFETAVQAITTETDASLIRNWLTPEAARALNLYHYEWAQELLPQHGRVWVARRAALPTTPEAWERWRAELAEMLVRPVPEVWVTAVDHGVLVLTHQTPSRPLDPEWTQATLKAVRDLWGGSVRLIDGARTYVEPETIGGRGE